MADVRLTASESLSPCLLVSMTFMLTSAFSQNVAGSNNTDQTQESNVS